MAVLSKEFRMIEFGLFGNCISVYPKVINVKIGLYPRSLVHKDPLSPFICCMVKTDCRLLYIM